MDWIQTIPTAIVLADSPDNHQHGVKVTEWVSSEERVKRSLALRGELLRKSGLQRRKAFKSIDGKIERDLERYCNFNIHIENEVLLILSFQWLP